MNNIATVNHKNNIAILKTNSKICYADSKYEPLISISLFIVDNKYIQGYR